jgi:hypothetical protein
MDCFLWKVLRRGVRVVQGRNAGTVPPSFAETELFFWSASGKTVPARCVDRLRICTYICTLYLQVDLHGTHRLPKGFTVVAYALNPQQQGVQRLPRAARSIPSSMCSIGRRLEAGCGGRRQGKVGRICCQTQKKDRS